MRKPASRAGPAETGGRQGHLPVEMNTSPSTALTAAPANQSPDTTPDRPYLTDFALRDSTRGNRADSIGT